MRYAFFTPLALAALAALALPSQAKAGRPFLDLVQGTGGISDLKALAVGDIVTIIISESSSANSTAKTDANNKTEVSGGPGLGMLSLVTDWGLTAENKYKGDGKTSRTGSLNAKISTRVAEVLENGNYRLEGQRIVEVNGEKQRIKLTGVIRPQDVDSDNTIASTYVADANIIYDGRGPIATSHSPGILTRLVNFIF